MHTVKSASISINYTEVRNVDSPLCRCEVREGILAHILSKCEALASLRHAYLGSFFLEPKDIQSISLGTIWSFSEASGLP